MLRRKINEVLFLYWTDFMAIRHGLVLIYPSFLFISSFVFVFFLYLVASFHLFCATSASFYLLPTPPVVDYADRISPVEWDLDRLFVTTPTLNDVNLFYVDHAPMLE
jgi:hypothetical protein